VNPDGEWLLPSLWEEMSLHNNRPVLQKLPVYRPVLELGVNGVDHPLDLKHAYLGLLMNELRQLKAPKGAPVLCTFSKKPPFFSLFTRCLFCLCRRQPEPTYGEVISQPGQVARPRAFQIRNQTEAQDPTYAAIVHNKQ